jgi:diguanylate cyclase (GGDEF)-like protein
MTQKTARVLIVEGRPANAQALAEAVESDKEVHVTGTADRALEVAPSCDLILLGAASDVDGLEMCRRLGASDGTKGIPVILVTALDAGRAIEAGAVDVVGEPAVPAVVRARVRTHLELRFARIELERLARTDALTGIANRRRFDETLEEEWRRSMRASHRLSLAFADIDGFKAFNEQHGHEGGDLGLRAVGGALQSLCRRPGEVVARYGGQEFAFLLPEVDAEAARKFVTRALDAVSVIEVKGLVAPGDLSVSMGIVTLVPSPLKTLENTLHVARERLHQAKGTGPGRGMVQDLETGEDFEVEPAAKA